MQEALVLLMLIIFPVKVASSSATPSEPALSLPGCPDKCGDVTIPYPFGIGDGCAAISFNPSFAVTCNSTFQPPRPMIYAPASADSNTSTPMEVINISLERGEVSIYAPVGYSCFEPNTNTLDNYTGEFSLEGTPLILSSTRNHFMAIGCSALGLIGSSNPDLSVAGCFSYCEGLNQTSDGAPCSGKGCCETTISPNVTAFQAVVANVTLLPSFNPCIYAMLVQVGWYSFRRQDLVGHLGFISERATRGVPVLSDWAIRNGSCVTAPKVTREILIFVKVGCCLEVDVPMLVYEFISSGTLFEFLHENDQRLSAPLDLRLKIATQSAEALAYIHSSTSRTILHGDVKSLNILLGHSHQP